MNLDMYEQCKYKMQIIKKKKEKVMGGHKHVSYDMQTIIIVIVTKNKMK